MNFFKKPISNKYICITAYTIALAGLSAELLVPLVNFKMVTQLFFIRSFFQNVYFSFMNTGLFEYSDFSSHVPLNFVNVGAYALLLGGVIAYQASKERETRLIRFVLSLAFLYASTSFLSGLYSAFVYYQHFNTMDYGWLLYTFGQVKEMALIYALYRVLLTLQQGKALDHEYIEHNDYRHYNAVQTPRLQRFFHLVIDSLLCFMLMWFFTMLFTTSLLEFFASQFGERAALYAYLLVARLFYYLFFELTLQTTPAKLLTESRVVTDRGEQPPASTIFKRTLGRYIPLEPFSFFGEGGWHDSISYTLVIKEKRTGIHANWYLLFFPIVIVLSLSIYFGNVAYEDYQRQQAYRAEHDQNINALKEGLKKLNISDIIELEEITYNYEEKTILKVEHVTAKDITVSILTKEYDYSKSLWKIEQLYEKNKENMSQLTIPRTSLDKAYTEEYEKSSSNDRRGIALLKDGKRFEIKRIARLYEPCIESGSFGSSYGNSYTIQFENYGWPAKVISIQTLEGKMNWINEFPVDAPTIEDNSYPKFNLQWDGNEEDYLFHMTVEDSLRHRQVYEVKGKGINRTMTRVK